MTDELDRERLDALLAQARALPREAEPPAQAWAAIRQRIEGTAGAGRTGRASRTGAPSTRWWLAAAAAVVLAATGAWWAASGSRDAANTHVAGADGAVEGPANAQASAESVGSRAVAESVGPNAPPALPVSLARANPTLAAALDAYRNAASDLEREVARRARLAPPGTLESVQRSLTAIDAAIAELEAALGSAPRDADLGQRLTTVFERKLEFLRRVRSMPGIGT